jgi:hypothetical protein
MSYSASIKNDPTHVLQAVNFCFFKDFRYIV